MPAGLSLVPISRGGTGAAGAGARGAIGERFRGQASVFSRRRFFRRLVARVFGGLEAGFNLLDFATRAFFGFATRVVLGLSPCFLGGRKDGDFFLLTPLRIAAGGVTLLLDQSALPRREFCRGQRSACTRCGPGGGSGSPRGNRDIAWRRRRRAGRIGWRRRGPGALFAHLHLHDLRAAMAEGLPYRARIDRPPQFQPRRWSEGETSLAAVLIVAFAHALPVGIHQIVDHGGFPPCRLPTARPEAG